MPEAKYRGEKVIYYKKAELDDLKYIKILYSDITGEIHELKTTINYMSDNYISLYVKKSKKEDFEDEEDSVEIWREHKEDNEFIDPGKSYNDYLKKLAEIKEIKDRAQETGNYDEYYKRLEELKNNQTESKETEEEEDKQNQEEFDKQEEIEEQEQEEDHRYEVECPQEVLLKFVIGELLYTAKTTLKEVEARRGEVYFRISAPEKLEFQQQRKFYRIDLRRLCFLVATNKEGNSTAYAARSINLSAGGVLINRLEPMRSNKFISINPEDYDMFDMVLVLELDKILKLSARCIREEEGKKSYRYAFEFTDIPIEKTDYISKYVVRKQFEEIQLDYKIKNSRIGQKLL